MHDGAAAAGAGLRATRIRSRPLSAGRRLPRTCRPVAGSGSDRPHLFLGITDRRRCLARSSGKGRDLAERAEINDHSQPPTPRLTRCCIDLHVHDGPFHRLDRRYSGTAMSVVAESPYEDEDHDDIRSAHIPRARSAEERPEGVDGGDHIARRCRHTQTARPLAKNPRPQRFHHDGRSRY
jgi:hypothetical protein